eukprot:CAMPEP_0206525422 /NCGR_PEP_ID=MMETSP0324_2-20121206/68723_1 /ASSEMBLY_ACC=CAM_ASM_000836 /TAXON_ID=2866 /ORGANISM="Crypthecodinium cohnii, Strain Seligo" /LENGTH=95 /DNA_ID=CAMNT_0054020083 /DNA_START=42 /DNA_END=329 /DNA_ORIENTATION=+
MKSPTPTKDSSSTKPEMSRGMSRLRGGMRSRIGVCAAGATWRLEVPAVGSYQNQSANQWAGLGKRRAEPNPTSAAAAAPGTQLSSVGSSKDYRQG